MASRHTLLAVFLLLSLCACQHERIEPSTIEPIVVYKPWEKVDLYKYSSTNILSSFATDSFLYSATPYTLSVWDKRAKTSITHYGLGWATYVYNPKPIFSERIVATFTDSIVHFRPVLQPVSGSTFNLSVRSSEISPNYSFVAAHKRGAFSRQYADKVYFLTFMEHNQSKALVLVFIELDYKENSNFQGIKRTKTNILTLNNLPNEMPNSIQFLSNRFYVTTTNNSYDVDATGNLRRFTLDQPNSALSKFFEIGQDSIVGISQLNELFLSINGRTDWQRTATITGTHFSTFKFYRFKNRQFLSTGLSLYEWNLDNNDLAFFNISGLPDNNLVEFHLIKDTLFVTTEGSGVYKKAFNDLQKQK